MYSLLVTSEKGAWDASYYRFDLVRFGEYTPDSIIEKFEKLNKEAINELMSFPALFAYEEPSDADIQIGWLRHISLGNSTVMIEYEMDPSFPPIPASALSDLKYKLDIEKWEMNRTHWAIKNKNLFDILSNVGIFNQKNIRRTKVSSKIEDIKFKVALSFPGEKRPYIKKVVKELKSIIKDERVFYDDDFKAQLAKPNLDTLLEKIYRENSELIVVFLCSEYNKKTWCGLEWRAIRDLIKERGGDSIMIMRFDNTPVEGSFSIDGFIDLKNMRPKQAAKLILDRVDINENGGRK